MITHGAIAWGAHPEEPGVIAMLKAFRHYVILTEDRIIAGGGSTLQENLQPCELIAAVNSCSIYRSAQYPQHLMLAQLADQCDGWLKGPNGEPCVTIFKTRVLDIRNPQIQQAWIDSTRDIGLMANVEWMFVDECYTQEYMSQQWGIDATGWTDSLRRMLLGVMKRLLANEIQLKIMVNSSNDLPALPSISGWYNELSASYSTGTGYVVGWLIQKCSEISRSHRRLLVRVPASESAYWQGLIRETLGPEDRLTVSIMEYHGDYRCHPVKTVIEDHVNIDLVSDDHRTAVLWSRS